mgnify:CR=1 FL=1
MSTIIEILTAAALILSIIIPGGAFLLGERNKKRYKKSLAVNCFFFFGTLLVGTIAMFAGAQNVQVLLTQPEVVLQPVLVISVPLS